MPSRFWALFRIDLAAKIRWRMQFDRNPNLVRLQDKFALREYAAARKVRTPLLYHVTSDADSIPFESLPRDYMIKATHGCRWNILCGDSSLRFFGDGGAPGEPLSREQVIEICRVWLGTRYGTNEWAYSHIEPRIVVEELIRPREGLELMDYRFYTFDGEVRAISVGSPRYRRERLNVFFDRHWNPFELTRYGEALPDPLPARPLALSEMLNVAARLGRDVDFVRVDLYDSVDGVILGECSVYPEAGNRWTPTGCPRFNIWLGDQWQMSRRRKAGVVTWNVIRLGPDIAADVRRRLGRRGSSG